MDNHDDLLFSMLRDCKTLPVFLDHIFGFLSRRTDFYHIAPDVHSPVGLPQGLAEQIVRDTFFNHKPKPKSLENDTVKEEPTLKPNVSLKTEPSVDFTTSESYNGAKYGTYSWSQSILELDIIVKLPKNTTAKALSVDIQSDRISVRLKNGATLLEGDLCDKCKHNEALWSVQRDKLEIHLDKARELWWNCLTTNEPKLDVNKLDCSRPYEELSEEAQSKIEELQWNQERKNLGLPTSDQLAMESVLKEAWHKEGSPFTGPFDPAKVQLH